MVSRGGSMMLGMLILTTFLVSLPWPWYAVGSVGPFVVRPVIVAAVPVVLYFLWKSKFNLQPINYRIIAILLSVYVVWSLPVLYNAHPHWQAGKLVSLAAYTVIAYFAARLYLLVYSDQRWNMYWPVVSIAFLTSCALSYYMAFGTLIPDTNIATSRDFIHGALYGEGVFSDPEAAKGIRHTMAIVPTLLLALVVHNSRHVSALNIVIFSIAMYLVLFSFSRSAWLVAFLISLMVFRYSFKNLSRNVNIIVIFMFATALALPVLSMLFPQQFSWVWNILGDRISDDKSTSARLWIIGELFTMLSFEDLLFGYNRIMQSSPHNMVLDALLQSGVLGAVGALVITVYVMRIYIRGFQKGDFESITAAALVAPAFVRIFTAGSGMLHMADLLGVCIAAHLKWYYRSDAGNVRRVTPLDKGASEISASATQSGRLLAGRTRFTTGIRNRSQ